MKKNHVNKLLVLFLLVTFTFACDRDNKELESITPASKENFIKLRTDALEKITETKSFKAEEGLHFTSKNGATLTISPNCLRDEDNNVVTGNVELTFVDIYDKGNMVVTNKPVMANGDEVGKPVPLVTGGQYFLSIKQGNKKLHSACYYQLDVPGALTGGIDSEMILWDGTIDAETGNLVYDESDDRKGGVQGGENAQYQVMNNRFGWTNIDKFWSYEGAKTRIKVTVPDGYNGDNAALYVVFDDEKNALAQLDVFVSAEKYFTEHYGFLPIGKKIHLIFVSESNGSALYVIKSVTIQANQSINIAQSEFKTGTLDQIVTLINALN